MKHQVLIHSNGLASVFKEDEEDSLGGELNKPWIIVYAEHLHANGIDPTQCSFDMIVNGMKKTAYVYELDGEYRWGFNNT